MSTDVRVAPNIYRTPYGWRVYVKRDGVLRPVRFKPDATLEQLQQFVDAFKEESERLRQKRAAEALAGSFTKDARRYLQLRTVRAMPSFSDREHQIDKWIGAFRGRRRDEITARDIDEQLQAFRSSGLAPATVNKLRTALMHLWTKLDGRGAANPVRETTVFEEPAPQPRGRSYDLIRQLLDAMPADRSRPTKGEKGSRDRGSLTRVRFELMAWTGMTPKQIAELKPDHFNVRERWYISPRRHKGARRPRHPRPVIKKPMTDDAAAAFARFHELKAYGPFSVRSLRHSLERARKKVERELREESGNNAIVIPPIRPYDFRHSFGTELYRQTGRLDLVAEMLDHASLQMSKRYALGAVSDVLREGMQRFGAATGNPFRRLPVAKERPGAAGSDRQRSASRSKNRQHLRRKKREK